MALSQRNGDGSTYARQKDNRVWEQIHTPRAEYGFAVLRNFKHDDVRTHAELRAILWDDLSVVKRVDGLCTTNAARQSAHESILFAPIAGALGV